MQQHWIGNEGDRIKARLLDVAMLERPLRVVSMMTDVAWGVGEVRAYAAQLGVSDSDVGPLTTFMSKGRRSYFSEAGRFVGDGDVFVDPDVGVAGAKATTAHVTVEEVGRLVASENVVAIYQHRPRVGEPWLTTFVERLRPLGSVLGCSTSKVGMLFVSADSKRIARIRARLQAAPATRELQHVG